MIIEVRAKPGAKKEEIEQISGNKYVVCLRQKAEDNKANIELLKLLKKHFNCEVKLVKGLKSKNKLVELK